MLSICTVASKEVLPELILWIRSIRLFVGDCQIFIGADAHVSEYVSKLGDSSIIAIPIVEEKFNIDRVGWDKTRVIDYGLKYSKAVLYSDCDVLFIGQYTFPEITSNPGFIHLSPHYIREQIEKQYGRFNSGYVGVSDEFFPQWWRSMLDTHKSLYGDQQLLDLADNENVFNVSKFPEHHNIGWWRDFHKVDIVALDKKLTVDGDKILYKDVQAISVHTHLIRMNPYTPLNERLCCPFNHVLMQCLRGSKCDKHASLVKLIDSFGVNS